MAKRRNKNKKAGPVKVIRPAEPGSPVETQFGTTDAPVEEAASVQEVETSLPAGDEADACAAVVADAVGDDAKTEPVAEAVADATVDTPAADAVDPTLSHADVSTAEAMLAVAASQLSSERGGPTTAPVGIEIPGFTVADADAETESGQGLHADATSTPVEPLQEFDDASALLAQAAPVEAGAELARRAIESIAIPGASAQASEVDINAIEEADAAGAQPARKGERTLKLKKLKKHVRSVGEPAAEPEPAVPVEEERRGPSEPRIAAFAQLAQYQSLSLAHVPGLPEETDVPGHWRGVGFGIGGRRFVAGFDEVVEIIRMPQVTHVPGTQPWMLGVANVRGTLLPVVDLKQFLEGVRTVVYEGQRVMVIRQGGGNVAVLIDQLYGQRTFNDSHKLAVAAAGATRYDHFIKLVYRVGDNDWGVFSMAMLTRTPEFRQAAA